MDVDLSRATLLRTPNPFSFSFNNGAKPNKFLFSLLRTKLTIGTNGTYSLSLTKVIRSTSLTNGRKKTPLQLSAANFWLDEWTNALNTLFKDGAFELQNMCANIPLLRERARGIDLGECLSSLSPRSLSPFLVVHFTYREEISSASLLRH